MKIEVSQEELLSNLSELLIIIPENPVIKELQGIVCVAGYGQLHMMAGNGQDSISKSIACKVEKIGAFLIDAKALVSEIKALDGEIMLEDIDKKLIISSLSNQFRLNTMQLTAYPSRK